MKTKLLLLVATMQIFSPVIAGETQSNTSSVVPAVLVGFGLAGVVVTFLLSRYEATKMPITLRHCDKKVSELDALNARGLKQQSAAEYQALVAMAHNERGILRKAENETGVS